MRAQQGAPACLCSQLPARLERPVPLHPPPVCGSCDAPG